MGLLVTVKARKLAYYGHRMRKQGSCLEKEIMQGTMPGEAYLTILLRCTQAGEDHAWPGWTTSIRKQNYPWKSHSK